MSRELTYCLSYPLILTRACANNCGYCGYPLGEPGRLPSPRVVRQCMREAMALGANQIELVAGEGIDTEPGIIEAVRFYGFDSYRQYLTHVLQMIEATNSRSHLFSLLNIGPVSLADLRLMRPYLCAARILLESADQGLEYREAHRYAPAKLPQERLEAVLNCGKAHVPLTTGIMVGIGEKRESRAKAFEILAEAHERYGHIQMARIQMFHPVSGTPMVGFAEMPDGEFLETIAEARRILGPAVRLQVSADEHPHLIGDLIDAGVDDLGDVSVRRPPKNVSIQDLITILAAECDARDVRMARRFPVHGAYCTREWYPSGFPTRIPRARTYLTNFPNPKR